MTISGPSGGVGLEAVFGEKVHCDMSGHVEHGIASGEDATCMKGGVGHSQSSDSLVGSHLPSLTTVRTSAAAAAADVSLVDMLDCNLVLLLVFDLERGEVMMMVLETTTLSESEIATTHRTTNQ